MADEVEPNGPAATDLPIVGNENLKPPEGAENNGRVPGTPTTALCARSVVVGTSAGNNNKTLTHVCGFIDDMSKNIYLKKFIKSTAQSIRESIRAILKTLGLSDKSGIFAAISAKLKEAARWLKTVQKFLKDVINFEKYKLCCSDSAAPTNNFSARFHPLLNQLIIKPNRSTSSPLLFHCIPYSA